MCRCRASLSASEGLKVHHLLLRDAVPDRQKDLFAADRPSHEPVELVCLPALARVCLVRDESRINWRRGAIVYRLASISKWQRTLIREIYPATHAAP